uniref:Uncharacterized protein n=1 Tax=Arundo donax TaxID=35708 RepID=A0A0A9AH47_ARUDO
METMWFLNYQNAEPIDDDSKCAEQKKFGQTELRRF